MTTTEAITNYASMQQAPFSRKELIIALCAGDSKASEQTVNLQLNRLVSSGKLTRVRFGYYSLPTGSRKEYVYIPSKEEMDLSRLIKSKFPFIDYCVWSPSKLARFMQHVPNVGTILVDVERDVMESVFMALQSEITDRQVLLHPSKKEIEIYSNSLDSVIVRPLVHEAPLSEYNGYNVPRIEKMLVDAAGDAELDYMGGSELYTIYGNAFEAYSINKSKLLRYAARRNRKNRIEQILKEIKHD